MTGQTLAALKAAHLTIYEAIIEFYWEDHPYLTEEQRDHLHTLNPYQETNQ